MSRRMQISTEAVDQLIDDPSTSPELKAYIRHLLNRDPFIVMNELQKLESLFEDRYLALSAKWSIE